MLNGKWVQMLPERSADTMSDAIALSSPNGRMSKRAHGRALSALESKLFDGGPVVWVEPTAEQHRKHAEQLMDRAKFLRHLAASGMKPRAYAKEAGHLEADARDALEAANWKAV